MHASITFVPLSHLPSFQNGCTKFNGDPPGHHLEGFYVCTSTKSNERVQDPSYHLYEYVRVALHRE